MFAARPGDDIVKDQMIFCLEPIALCTAACKGIQYDDLRSSMNAGGGRVLARDKNADLIDDGIRERRLLRVKHLVFAIVKIRCNFRQVDTADYLIPYVQTSVVESHRVCG